MKFLPILVILLVAQLGAQEEDLAAKVLEMNKEAVALTRKGDHEAAVKILRNAVDLQKRAQVEVDAVVQMNLVRTLISWASQLADLKKWSDAEARLLEARRIDGDYALIYAWEGVLAYRQGLFNAAMDRLDEALRKDAKLAMAHEFQGMIHYKRENLELALRSFERTIELDPERKTALENFMAKVKRELERERDMRVLRATHFVCKFGDEQERSVAEEVLNYLEDAYARVGAALGEYPEESLTVVLYADRDFHAVTGSQAWAGGIFDGKIRVPIRNFSGVRRQIKATLAHEYTHFVVSKLHRGTPAWLNEGLAQVMEEQSARAVNAGLKRLAEEDKLVPLRSLLESFSTEPDASKVRLYYAQSLSFVDFLKDRSGLGRVGDLIRRLGAGSDIDAACRYVYGEKLDDLEADWKSKL